MDQIYSIFSELNENFKNDCKDSREFVVLKEKLLLPKPPQVRKYKYRGVVIRSYKWVVIWSSGHFSSAANGSL